MRITSLIYTFIMTLVVAACNTVMPTQVANVACLSAETGAAVAVAVTADANFGGNVTKGAAQAQQTAATIQKTISDACPQIVAGADAISTAARNPSAAK